MKLTVVGAGIGDPELLTIKGLKALQQADVVLYDALANEALLDHAPNHALRIFVGKRRTVKTSTQEETNDLIVQYARTHGHVVRLKGGDPFVFGRGFEEMEYARRHGIEAEYVPGISSAVAAPGLAGIPVTYRNLSRSFWVVTATNSDGELSADLELAAQSDATIVVLMGLSKLSEIAAIFKRYGKSDLPAAVLQNSSLSNAKHIFGTVDTLEHQLDTLRTAPSVLIFGEVVGLDVRRALEGLIVEGRR
jgi:uroporphyrin-III C-methyltransferase